MITIHNIDDIIASGTITQRHLTLGELDFIITSTTGGEPINFSFSEFQRTGDVEGMIMGIPITNSKEVFLALKKAYQEIEVKSILKQLTDAGIKFTRTHRSTC